MCTINFSQTILGNDNNGVNQEVSSFALSEPMNGMAVVSINYYFSLKIFKEIRQSMKMSLCYILLDFIRYLHHALLLTL